MPNPQPFLSLTRVLLALGVLAGSVACEPGGDVAGEPADGTRAERERSTGAAASEPASGRFQRIEVPAAREAADPELRERMEHLRSLGYLGASSEATHDDVVTRHEPGAAEGYGFYVSGHGPEAFLIDREGNELHRWRKPYDEVWPDRPPIAGSNHYFRRAHLFPNGDVLTFYANHVRGLIKIDRDSNLLWANRDLGTHHELAVADDGDIYVLTRELHVIPSIDETAPVLEDYVSIVSSEGVEKRRVSMLEALSRSPWWDRWEERERECEGRFDESRCADLFHTNSIEILDGRGVRKHPAFRPGNILTSFRHLDAIAVVDLEAVEVVWLHHGEFAGQHDPSLLDDGNVLLFDNHGLADGASRVLEIDPATGETVWSYRGSEKDPFFSDCCGAATRLANGNTLISDSESGRAFEVTPDSEIVWEFYNPNRAEEDRQLIGVLFELTPLPPDFPVEWARGVGGSRAPGSRGR